MLQIFSPSLSAVNFVSGDFTEQKSKHDGCLNISDSIEVKRSGEIWELFQTMVN